MNNEIFNRIKSEHPEWSDEQVWTAVSLEMQTDTTIEKEGKDVDPNDPQIFEKIIRGAKMWLEAVLPAIFAKVSELFENFLKNIHEWIQKGIHWIITNLPLIWTKI